jgi:eukaryotic-like serine/threonine-protein kinase
VAERYRLVRPLGVGGMGDVWEATHLMTGRAVAIKRLRSAPHEDRASGGRARFILEAQAACAVEHPNVVEILDLLEMPGERPVIVMELLRGETLADRLARDRSLSVEETARLLLPVVSAVGTAHSRGIIHRDLKPANIFLEGRDGNTVVKVLDFGIAKWVGMRPDSLGLRTETGSTLGTPCYMAPEQAMGERVLDHRADVWSLGVILYECLCGERPVEGENAARIMVRLMSTGIIPIERIVPGLPSSLSALVGRMLSRELDRRPKSLRDVRSVLEPLTAARAPDFGEPDVELAQPLELPASPPDAPTPAAFGEGRDPRPGRAHAKDRRRTKRWSLLLAGGAAALGAVVQHALSPRVPAETTANLATASHGRASERPSVARLDVTAVPRPAKATSAVAPAAGHPATAPARPRPVPSRVGGAGSASPPTDSSGLPPGAPCERSRDCASRLCLALACQ